MTTFSGFIWSWMPSHDQICLDKPVLAFVDLGQLMRLQIVKNATSFNFLGNRSVNSSF